jgi:hypothetical protein
VAKRIEENMIHALEWTVPARAAQLPALRENIHRHGGIIVQYQRIYSLILFSLKTTHWIWVPPYRSRRAIGLEFALPSLLFGLWSLPGFLSTPTVILNNILGGAEVTGLVAGPPFLKEQQNRAAAIKELDKIKNRERYVLLLMVVLLFFFGDTVIDHLPAG